ncbi:sentrin-specific protease 2-like [Melanotaenia boesemani]|uniref:sentrin-specific protease 2-like n=1 Tax=Melanotaenia boesemani TaxID=1250792 RepID=UPI001C0422AC|nr:sentrin-specific protease 2-like [Melanotaenia boesemani]
MNPMDYEIILGINNHHHHWTLVVIYPHEKRSLFLDPLGESKKNIKQCLEITRAFMRRKGCSVSRWTCDTVEHPKQPDSTSCGVFALKFAERVLDKEPVDFPASRQAVNKLRFDIAVRLLQSSDDLENLCHFCGEMDSEKDFNWVTTFYKYSKK